MLDVTGLSKDFHMHIRDGLILEGLSNVSFTARPGELLAITGPSGIGKSTLLKCIYRTYLPTSGEILYTARDGSVINLACADEQTMLRLRKTEIGYVSQFLHVIPRVAAVDILAAKLVRHSAAFSFAERDQVLAAARRVASESLASVGLPANLHQMYPSTFSGGEKQRLNILLALATRPRLLLLDEPTASLDAASKRIIIDLIRAAKTPETTMIGVFHDRDAIAQLADRRLELSARPGDRFARAAGAAG